MVAPSRFTKMLYVVYQLAYMEWLYWSQKTKREFDVASRESWLSAKWPGGALKVPVPIRLIPLFLPRCPLVSTFSGGH